VPSEGVCERGKREQVFDLRASAERLPPLHRRLEQRHRFLQTLKLWTSSLRPQKRGRSRQKIRGESVRKKKVNQGLPAWDVEKRRARINQALLASETEGGEKKKHPEWKKKDQWTLRGKICNVKITCEGNRTRQGYTRSFLLKKSDERGGSGSCSAISGKRGLSLWQTARWGREWKSIGKRRGLGCTG